MASTTDEKTAAMTVTTITHTADKTSTTTNTTLAPSLTGSLAPSPEIGFRRSSDVSTPATAHNELNPFDTDLEAMISSRSMTEQDDSCGMKSVSKSNLKGSPEGQVWPGQDHWKKKAKAAKINQRSCQCLAKMSKRNRMITKVLIGAVILAIAVGVGLGISRAVGAGVWKPSSG